jgi:hypothetical protein
VAYVWISFLFKGWIIFPCIYHILFIHSSIDVQMDCFHLVAIVHDAATNVSLRPSF